MAKVRLDSVTRKFAQVTAIEEMSLEVPDGQFWVLVGPSGCGKSTILRMIAGLEEVTTGNIYLDEMLINQIPARQRDVAMVFQNYALYPHMTVAQNLAFGLRMRQMPKDEMEKRVEKTARSLNIDHLLHRKPKQLSGGQQQRVALGRAIIRQPKAFLLDEPLSNLDAQLRDDTRAELKQLHQQLGITTIYVTHDQIEAMTLADQIVVLNQGRMQQIGTPQEIYNQPQNIMVANFIGSPPMNIFPATRTEEGFFVAQQNFCISPKISNKVPIKLGEQINFGIRPEHIVITSLYHDGEREDNHPRPGQLKVVVQVVEPLGKETLVKVKLMDSPLTINFHAPPYWRGKSGDRITIQLDLDKLFVFDVHNDQRIILNQS